MSLRLAQYHALCGESGWVAPAVLRGGVARLNEAMAGITYAQVDTTPPLSQPQHQPWLNQLIPPWVRMVGPLNRQHSTHDFTLDIHTQYVLAGAQTAVGFDALTAEGQHLVRWAALLHDISKTGGERHDKCAVRVDKQHPWKSAVMARWLMPRLGFAPLVVERVSRLIQFHQLFGTMIIRNPEWSSIPPESDIHHAAWAVGSVFDLDMLYCLTEGDIRGVKQHEALFSDRVRYKLGEYRHFVDDHLTRHHLPTWWGVHTWHLTPAHLHTLYTTPWTGETSPDVLFPPPVAIPLGAQETAPGFWWLPLSTLVDPRLDDCLCGGPTGQRQPAMAPVPLRAASPRQLPDAPVWLMVEALSDQLHWPADVLANFPQGWGRQEKFLAEHQTVQALLATTTSPGQGWPLSLADLLTRHGGLRVPASVPLVVGYGCRQGDEARACEVIAEHLAQRQRLGLRNDHWRRLPLLGLPPS